jgi:hypothetical protein
VITAGMRGNGTAKLSRTYNESYPSGKKYCELSGPEKRGFRSGLPFGELPPGIKR